MYILSKICKFLSFDRKYKKQVLDTDFLRNDDVKVKR